MFSIWRDLTARFDAPPKRMSGGSGQWRPTPGSTVDSLLTAITDGTPYPLFSGAFGSRYIHRDIAASYSAVYRCATLIASAVAGLPVQVMKQETHEVVRPGSKGVPGQIAELLARGPDPHMPTYSTIENITLDMALDGNFYLMKEVDPVGRVTGLRICNPWGGEIYTYEDQRIYFLTDEQGEQHWLDETEVIHGAMPRVWRLSHGYQTRSGGRFKGVAPVQAIRPALEIGLESDQFIKRFFSGNGYQPEPSVRRHRAERPGG